MLIQAWRAEVRTVIVAHAKGVEAFVVDGAQLCGAFGIIKQPAFKLGFDLGQFGLRRDGFDLVGDADTFDFIIDSDGARVQARLDQFQRV